jgi:radical SAM protein with 4Fe4S-binding SPASM domain
LVDWIIEKNKAGYQMVNSVKRLQEMKAFVRMSSGVDLSKYGWYGDGTATNGDIKKMLADMPGIVQEPGGDMHFTDWNCRAGQNNVIIRTDGTVAPCFPMYASTYNWGNIDNYTFDEKQLKPMKDTCQRHCFSTLNHNLGYCYNDRRVIKWMWEHAKRGFQGGARSFED